MTKHITFISVLTTLVFFVGLSVPVSMNSDFDLGVSITAAFGGGDDDGGGGDSGGCGSCNPTPTPTPTPVVPMPTCTISALPFSIVRGNSAQLNWSTSNAVSASLDQSIGAVAVGLSKARTVSPTQTTTYKMTVTNSRGSANCSTTVTVTAPPVIKTCHVGTSAKIIATGASVTISWQTTGFSNLTLNGVAVSGANGSKTYTNVQINTTYVLKASTADGLSNCTATVAVTCLPPVVLPPTCDSFTATPVTINRGSNATLAWTTTNATGVSINGGVGSVAPDGSKVVTPLTTTTYTLVATNAAGVTDSCPVKVTVVQPTPVATCDTFTATPVTINRGSNATLNWTTSNATTVTINNGVGSVAVDGLKIVTPLITTTYTLTATNAAGVTDSCPVKVTVVQPTPVATCDTFTATPVTINRGSNATLAWTTSNATTVTINNGIGAVAVDGSKIVTPLTTTTYTLVATNATGVTDSCPVTVTVVQPVALPTCALSLGISPALTAGDSTMLSWTSTNAVTRVIDQGIGSVAVSGTRGVNPSRTTTYTMTVANSAGVERTCTATLTVIPAPLAPTCAFAAAPLSITRGGQSVLSWDTTNASSVTINNGLGSVAVDGTYTVSPITTTTYTLTAYGANNKTVTCPVTVTVQNPPVDTKPICDSFTATPATLPARGGTVTLDWATTRATTVTINNGIGSVAVDGSRAVSVSTTTTFVLSARDADGDAVTCTTKVLVAPVVDTPITCSANVDFSANPSSIDEGDSTTLTWNTTGITSLSIDNGVSSNALDGSESVSPHSDTTYTLTATKGSTTISCPVTVNVDEDNGGGGGSPTPRCELDISDSSISLGDRVTLKWETSNATEITITDNFGKTLITTEDRTSRDKNDLYDGEITIRPEKDTTFTLLVERGSSDRECEVDVDVTDSVVVTQIRDQQPLVSGIALSQVPYTGFAAGPLLTVLFYSLLAAWALYLAYIFVIGRAVPVVATAAVLSAPLITEAVNSEELFVPKSINTPQFHHPAAVPVVTSTAVVGYHNQAIDEATAAIENQAHAAHVLLSSEATRHFMTVTAHESDRNEVFATVLGSALASYPSEDGWVVLSEERMMTLTAGLATPVVAAVSSFTPTLLPIGASSLAETIVSGNIGAAYQMIGNRPMIALADAAADLDALYRVKQGGVAKVSELLMSESAELSVLKLQAAIAALTGALDGTYTDEASAVKMAIMKATKEIHG